MPAGGKIANPSVLGTKSSPGVETLDLSRRDNVRGNGDPQYADKSDEIVTNGNTIIGTP